MIRDRGNIKWTAMMLPEHITELKSWKDEDDYIERPLFDEWELESIQMEIELAFKRQCDAKITIWKKGKTIMYTGKISVLDHRLGLISVEGPFGEDRIPVADVIRVDSMD
ncbi:YolD-like family protein [Sporosarcina sp. ANT_H38]|uniref:YolD-like family protein n=1 Tax=Sporosarcina sp. ANT_H38 TaxID=2597358 RepID=UPI0011F0E54A|nr:YolD-like family protein [Sporosarcina sp. ANT_H38]KAA0965810.1 YolD-like family protein [Sporosarcina sp. ANT_H38]